jgi:hypothetical protein
MSTYCGHSIPEPRFRLKPSAGVADVAEIKDSGSEFHWSRPRIVGLLFAALASPIFFVFAGFGHATLGGGLWFATCIVLMIAYVRPTPFRKFTQRLIPTSAERAERSGIDPN